MVCTLPLGVPVARVPERQQGFMVCCFCADMVGRCRELLSVLTVDS